MMALFVFLELCVIHVHKCWSLWPYYDQFSYWFHVLRIRKLLVLMILHPFHVQVCYYRYLRFFPSGKFLYKVPITTPPVICWHSTARFSLVTHFPPIEWQISPDKIKDAVKCMHFRASKADCVFKGDYILSEDGQVKSSDLFGWLCFLWQSPSHSITFFLIWATLSWPADRNGTPISRASVHTC